MQLRDASTRDEFVVAHQGVRANDAAGAWITGGDWDHTLWGGELPTREWIDAVTPDNPVWINRLDGHMALANSAALRPPASRERPGESRAERSSAAANGEPTGVLKDNAMSLVDAVVPAPSAELADRALAAAMKYVNEQGVTSVHNMGAWNDLDTFTRAARAKTLTTRIYAATSAVGLAANLRDDVQANAHTAALTAEAMSGCASAPSKDSSTARWARTRPLFTNPSTMRRRTAACW